MSNNIKILSLNNHVKPEIVETQRDDYVLNGKNNSYFDYVNDRYIGSPTNSAINNGYIRLIYGNGLSVRNQDKNVVGFLKLKKILKPNELKNIITDFQTQGMAYLQILKTGLNELNEISHIPVNKIAPQKADENNVINGYYYSKDWSNVRNIGNEPRFIHSYGSGKKIEIFCIKPYMLGMEYFALPSYQSGLQYAELEEEISNYSISHMKNGLSFGYIIDIPNSYNLTDEDKNAIETKIKKRLTGSSRAGSFIINFANGDKEIKVKVLEVNDAHKQWEFLSGEAQRKIIVSHEVVSPMLFGIKDANGFSNNADELDIAEKQTIKRIIAPKQNEILYAIETILIDNGINLDLYFKPLTEETENIIEEKQNTELSSDKKQHLDGDIADFLINLGEDLPDDWVELDSRKQNNSYLSEEKLNNIVRLAKTIVDSPKAKSEQDTSLFKIRYQYKGNPNPQREFCKKMINANKIYTVEAINKASSLAVNKGFGVNGADNYDIFLYKGGVNCKHFWERKIFLKDNDEQISVNQARRMILELDPEERASARWVQNPSEVAQIASPSNNNWRVN